MVVQSSIVKSEAELSGISEEALQRMVDDAIKNAKNKPAEDKNAAEIDGKMRAVERVLADKIYNRIISEGYYRPSWSSSYYRPYYPTYRPYLSGDLDAQIRRVLNYHTYVNQYEGLNKVLGHTLDPKLEEIIGVMYDLIKK